MSVQKVSPVFSVVTTCPLFISSAETVFTYQTASIVDVNKNVNGRGSECFPNDFVYLQNRPVQKPTPCCSNNALKIQSQSVGYPGMMMNYNGTGVSF
jgi:hypothetical protein